MEPDEPLAVGTGTLSTDEMVRVACDWLAVLYCICHCGVCVLDLKNRFDSLMLYGNELALVIFELLLICIVDSVTKDFVTDAVITFVVVEVSIHRCWLSRSSDNFSVVFVVVSHY